MTPITFFVAMIPRRKNRLKIHRFGPAGKFARLVADEKGKESQETLAARVYEHRPPTPFTGPVVLEVTFVMPIPTGWPAWKRKAAIAERLLPTSRPDRGNLLKLLEDALKGPFYVDDSQVVDGPVRKIYGEIPGYQITIDELPTVTRESEKARCEPAKPS